MCLLVLQWGATESSTCVRSGCEEHVAEQSNAEHTGKADNQTYKQSACQAVAKEVKSHFPWIPPSEYG